MIKLNEIPQRKLTMDEFYNIAKEGVDLNELGQTPISYEDPKAIKAKFMSLIKTIPDTSIPQGIKKILEWRLDGFSHEQIAVALGNKDLSADKIKKLEEHAVEMFKPFIEQFTAGNSKFEKMKSSIIIPGL